VKLVKAIDRIRVEAASLGAAFSAYGWNGRAMQSYLVEAGYYLGFTQDLAACYGACISFCSMRVAKRSQNEYDEYMFFYSYRERWIEFQQQQAPELAREASELYMRVEQLVWQS